MSKKRVTIKHPVFKDVEFDVEQDRLDDFLAAGWLEKNQRRVATVSTEADDEVTTSPTE